MTTIQLDLPKMEAFGGHMMDIINHSLVGFGLSVGWQGQLTSSLTLGANYASKVRMSRMDEFEGLLAGVGSYHRVAVGPQNALQ